MSREAGTKENLMVLNRQFVREIIELFEQLDPEIGMRITPAQKRVLQTKLFRYALICSEHMAKFFNGLTIDLMKDIQI